MSKSYLSNKVSAELSALLNGFIANEAKKFNVIPASNRSRFDNMNCVTVKQSSKSVIFADELEEKTIAWAELLDEIEVAVNAELTPTGDPEQINVIDTGSHYVILDKRYDKEQQTFTDEAVLFYRAKAVA